AAQRDSKAKEAGEKAKEAKAKQEEADRSAAAADEARIYAEGQRETAECLAEQAQFDQKVAEKRADDARRDAYASAIGLVHREWKANDSYRAWELLRQTPEDLRSWEWGYFDRLDRAGQHRLDGHIGGSVRAVAYSPDGRSLASGGNGGVVKVWLS